VGQASKAYFLKHNLALSQLIYAPHAIDNERFSGNENNNYDIDALYWRNKLGYHEDDIVIIFAGKFENKKQPGFLIEAIEMANKQRGKPLKLLMVGSGPLEKDLKKVSKNNNNIQFLSFQNQTKMPLVYRLGAVLCLPSKGP